MSETADYSPGDWKGYDFDAARKTYDKHVGRSYSDAKKDNKRTADLVPEKIKTNAKRPLVILVDVTGSMGDWPATMFSKLPYMEHECKEYLGEDMEISFAAVGDVHSDNYPIQVRPFVKGRDLEKQLKELVIEGNGGGQARESYELTALYYAHNAEMPEAERPIMVIIGDEGFYDRISKAHAKLAHVKLEKDLKTTDLFEELSELFSVYIVRKPYNHYAGEDDHIQKEWETLLGKEHVAILPSADRVVDVIFGILAKERDMVDYFMKEIEERQRPDQVRTVYKSLKTIHSLPARNPKPADKGKSVMHKAVKGKKTKKLLGK
jgi:hypothetical protein